MPTVSQLTFLAWAKIKLASLVALSITRESIGYDVSSVNHKIILASLFIKEIEYFVYLPEIDRLCLTTDEICDMVRELKKFFSDC